MILVPPGLLNVGLRDARGLNYLAGAYQQPVEIATVDSDLIGTVVLGTELTPGQETAVTMPTSLPPNANVHSVVATIIVGGSREDAKNAPTVVSVSKNGEKADTFSIAASPSDVPSNVTVRLDGGDVFWSQSGPLARGRHDLPDFAEALNTYLDGRLANGQGELVFQVKSDSPGTAWFTMPLATVDYSLIQTQTWPNPLDQTLRVDRNLATEFGTVERLSLDAFQGPLGLHLSAVRLDVGGQVGAERLFGPIPAYDGRELATVSSDYSVAQALSMDVELDVVGLTCRLLPDDATELFVALYADASGLPDLESPIASGTLTSDAAPPDAVPEWRYVAFDDTATMPADTEFWAVLKAVRGGALVAMQQGAPPRQRAARVNRGGSAWADLGGSALLVCPVHLPRVDTSSAAVAVRLEGGPSDVRLDVAQDPALVELPSDGAGPQPVLVVESYARGTVSIANVVQEYVP